MKFLTYAYTRREDRGFEWVEDNVKAWLKRIVETSEINYRIDDILDGIVKKVRRTVMRIKVYDLPDYVRNTARELLKNEGYSDDLNDYVIIEVYDEVDFDFSGIILFIPKEWL